MGDSGRHVGVIAQPADLDCIGVTGDRIEQGIPSGGVDVVYSGLRRREQVRANAFDIPVIAGGNGWIEAYLNAELKNRVDSLFAIGAVSWPPAIVE